MLLFDDESLPMFGCFWSIPSNQQQTSLWQKLTTLGQHLLTQTAAAQFTTVCNIAVWQLYNYFLVTLHLHFHTCHGLLLWHFISKNIYLVVSELYNIRHHFKTKTKLWWLCILMWSSGVCMGVKKCVQKYFKFFFFFYL